MSLPPPSPRTERGLERLVLFTDAVAAIAITLLVLPLVDIIPAPGCPRRDGCRTALRD